MVDEIHTKKVKKKDRVKKINKESIYELAITIAGGTN